LLKKFFYKKIF